MEITYDELERCMRYMKLDTEEDEPVALECLQSAREYLSNAGVSLPPEGSGRRVQYDMAAHILASSYYQRRTATVEGTAVTENPVLRPILNQLKLTEPPVSKLDT